MTIKNVIRAGDRMLELTGGSQVTLTSDPGPDSPIFNFTYHNACNKGAAWFEGRLWTFRFLNYQMDFRRWNDDDTWTYQPGVVTPSAGVTCLGYQTYASHKWGVPGLISYKDNIYMFWDRNTEYIGLVSHKHSWAYMRWNPNPAPNGATTIEAYETTKPGYYTQTYTKTAATVDNGHILDIIEYNGTLFVATPMNVFAVVPPTGDMSLVDEPSTNWDNMVTKSFGIFRPSSSSIGQLFILDANGKVNLITNIASEAADLKLINPNITNGNTASLGYGPALVNIGSTFYAFLNDTTGTVLFSSTDGTTWSNVTASLPSTWQSRNSHIKVCIDPSVPEVRVMFLSPVSPGAFDIYTFDGFSFTYLGSSASTVVLSYTFFDVGAADVEIEQSPVVDVIANTVTFNYQLFNEAGLTGTANLAAEYSIDRGITWFAATAGSGSDPLTGLNASDSRPTGAGEPYVFVWNYLADLGAGLFSNVRFRIRGA